MPLKIIQQKCQLYQNVKFIDQTKINVQYFYTQDF